MRIKNLRRYRIVKEIVPLLGIGELVLATYIGFQFGSQHIYRAWLFTGILAVTAYSSTWLWIWVLETMVKRGKA